MASSNTQVTIAFVDKLSPAILRAEEAFGERLRGWIQSEEALRELDFSDTVLVLHFLFAQISVGHALLSCSPDDAITMRDTYCEMVSVCFREQFDAAIRKKECDG